MTKQISGCFKMPIKNLKNDLLSKHQCCKMPIKNLLSIFCCLLLKKYIFCPLPTKINKYRYRMLD